jgi:alpha-beta hydrolase superfamily lysophospholipase
MDDEFEIDSARFADRGPAVTLRRWRLAPDAWRWSARLDMRHLDVAFRLRSARIMPASMKARFVAMGIPRDIVEETLASIRSVESWGDAWIETAQRFLGDYRRQVSSDQPGAGEEARRVAAMCYHAAQILIFDDPKTIALCRASTASLFAQAQPRLYPYAHRLRLPWRNSELPCYYMVPEDRGEPTPLVVMLNGATTAKEETFAWSRAFIQRGMAVVAIDSPGTGEASRVAPYLADDDDIFDGIFELISEQPNLDARRVVAVGASMGGNQAIRSLAHDRRILGAVAVTPAYEPGRWVHRANPVLRAQLQSLSGVYDVDAREQARSFDLAAVVGRVRKPVLVYGGGRDVVVPVSESQLLASKLGRFGTLVWVPDGGHCLYDMIPQWTAEAAQWIDAIGNARIGRDGEAIDDPVRLSVIGRETLDEPAPTMQSEVDDDLGDYARLIAPEEIRGDLKTSRDGGRTQAAEPPDQP